SERRGVNPFDVAQDQLPPRTIVAVGRQRLLVLRRQVARYALLDLVQRRARGRLATHGLDQVGDVATEQPEPFATRHVAVTEDHPGEVEPGEAVERLHPIL